MGRMQPSTLSIKVMAAFTAQELQIPVRFMCEEENWSAIHDMLAGETTFVGSEGETGKTDR
jgi:hypothetical protein